MPCKVTKLQEHTLHFLAILHAFCAGLQQLPGKETASLQICNQRPTCAFRFFVCLEVCWCCSWSSFTELQLFSVYIRDEHYNESEAGAW